jgi:cytoskeleton-associated protein 5
LLNLQNWKARVNGYEELAKLFKQFPMPNDPKYRAYLEYMPKMAQDSNAVAIESAIACITSFVSYSDLGAK